MTNTSIKQRLVQRRRVLGLLGLFGVGAYTCWDAAAGNAKPSFRPPKIQMERRSIDSETSTDKTEINSDQFSINPEWAEAIANTVDLDECAYEADGLEEHVAVHPHDIPTDEVVAENLADLDFVSDFGGCWAPTECRPRQQVAIIIPFKNRDEHLRALLNRLHPMLHKQNTAYCIFVAEQEDDGRFNKGAVMNAGFNEVMRMNKFDCVIFHDVDMLPESDFNIYQCQDSPTHLSPLIDKFDYKPYGTDFGGITMLRPQDYLKANGMSNMFWGWGREDDDMQHRVEKAKLTVSKPINYDNARYKMIPHQHPWIFRNFKIRDATTDVRFLPPEFLVRFRERFAIEGVNSVEYKLARVVPEKFYTKIYVELRRFEVNGVRTLKVNEGDEEEIGAVLEGAPCKYERLENTKICDEYGHTMVLRSLRKKQFTYREAIEECDKLGYMCVGFVQDEGLKYKLREVTQLVSADYVDNATCKTRGDLVFHKQCAGDASFVNLLSDITLPTYPADQNVAFQHRIAMTQLVPTRGNVVFRQALLVEGVQIGPIFSRVYESVGDLLEVDFSLPILMPGYYTLVSKLTDELGQPLYEWKSTMRATTGDFAKDAEIRKTKDVKEIFTSYGWTIQTFDEFKATFKRVFTPTDSSNKL